jgi:hypothetical protein
VIGGDIRWGIRMDIDRYKDALLGTELRKRSYKGSSGEARFGNRANRSHCALLSSFLGSSIGNRNKMVDSSQQ